ncbi:hypothetical protein Pint_06524 [Pistacia integerrima]|uniref:Uncharacterized protein n=1 Tax=Pistacia integerrima TaxID=434235 RepID=A0ACC0Z0J4_9ROSI|nr:hypothetical protein Pint_06524 [Pistacia integerrima]
MASVSSSPRTVEEIFKDFNCRRSALVRALTSDVDKFYSQCDPEKENLCLYGHPNESWEVAMPADEVPPEVPEPALGINFSRDGMHRKDWLSLVAVHSDCWLLAVAFYFGARLNRNERYNFVYTCCGYSMLMEALLKTRVVFATCRCNSPFLVKFNNDISNKSCTSLRLMLGLSVFHVVLHNPTDLDSQKGSLLQDIDGSFQYSLQTALVEINRKRLFSLINDLPTLFEVVTGRKPLKDKPSVDSGSKSRNGSKRSIDGLVRSNPKILEDRVEDEDDEHNETFCGSCGSSYNSDEFWIGCDICERWYHGKCVKITPAKAESIKQYKCPSCCTKKGRH